MRCACGLLTVSWLALLMGGACRADLIESARGGDAAAVRQQLADPAVKAPDRDRALVAAAGAGHLETVRLLLEAGAHPEGPGEELAAGAEYRGSPAYRKPEGECPMLVAAKAGHAEVIRALLEAGAHPDGPGQVTESGYRRRLGYPPLAAAAGGGYIEIVTVLLDAGADANCAWAESGGFALRAAAAKGHIDVVRLLLDRGASITWGDYPEGETPLEAATSHEQYEVAALLLERGAPPRGLSGTMSVRMARLLMQHGADPLLNPRFGSAIAEAIWGGRLDMVEAMLDFIPDLNAPPEGEWPPLYYAVRAGQAEITARLEERGARWTTAIASAVGNVEKLRELLAAGAQPEPRDLEVAAAEGHTELIGLLLDHGLDGRVALPVAAQEDQPEVARVLLEHGTDPNALDQLTEGAAPCSALQVAASWGHNEVARVLIEGGADVNARPGYGGQPPLALAANHHPLTLMLLEHGADPNIAADDGTTALHLAAGNGKPACVQALLEHGAMVDARDALGRTPLYLLAYGGVARNREPDLQSARLLIEHGANVNATDNLGRPILRTALNREIDTLLREHGARAEVTDPRPAAPGDGPRLIAPANGALLDNFRFPIDPRLGPTVWHFWWAPVDGATEYHFQILDEYQRTWSADQTGLTTTGFSKSIEGAVISLEHLLIHTWRVRAKVNGEWGPWSETWWFDVRPGPRW